MLVPVVAAAIVLPHVLDRGSKGVAEVQGPPTSQRDQLPVVKVQVPAVTPEAQASCPGLMEKLPVELAGEPSRRVDSATPFAYAWGEPPAILVCGVDRPAALSPTSGLIQINGVQWLVDTSRSDRIVWTAVDRPVYVQVTVSQDTDSAPVTALSTIIAGTLPSRQVNTGP